MAGGGNKVTPSVIWAQRKDKLYVTINAEDCKEPDITMEPDKLIFRGKGGPDNDRKDYEVTLEFFKEIVPEESKYGLQARHVPLVIKKKQPDSTFWPRLLKDSKKVHWLKTDFNKWRDEDDSDVDEQQDVAFEDMMQQMGNFNTDAPQEEPADDEDSDDEDLPDLE